MPKPHRPPSALRSQSRSSSSSKLPANLQFTQKDPPPPKAVEKSKKNGYPHDAHSAHGKSVPRVPSAQRVHSRDQLQPFVAKRGPAPQNPRNNGTRAKPGFTIASSGDDDDDEWISSESGVATPNDHQSHSDSESDHVERPPQYRANQHSSQVEPPPVDLSGFPRVQTARPSDFASIVVPSIPDRSETRTPTLPPTKTEQSPRSRNSQSRQSHDPGVNNLKEAPNLLSPRISSKRQSFTRPPSTHSTKGDPPLRPHPLIRGHSYGQIYPAKPAPLEPLTVMQDAGPSSPPGHIYDHKLSTSPTSSIKTNLTSPSSPDHSSTSHHRRTSISSVATLPTHSSLRDSVNWSLSDRRRTLSHSSSSAALSSLVHLPTVTRPPSPQAISFFPPVNPHANIEGIHPLLPAPYLHNHLTVLARRTPIKESFDRVIRAKHELRASN